MSRVRIHEMELPRKVIIGNHVLEKTSEVCKEFGLSQRTLLLSGPDTYALVGKGVEENLRKEGIETNHFIVRKSSMLFVKKARKLIKKLKPAVIIAVGGGKVIDVAKLSSAKEGTPFISIPTTASHDGIASIQASIKGREIPYSIKAQAPLAIIADVNVILESPYRLIASGCGDIIAKFTAVKDWKLAHEIKGEYYGEYAASLALMSAKLVMKHVGLIRKKDEEGIRVLLEALISCGVAMSIAGSSRPCSGSEHLFSHALDLIAPKPALHGEQCGAGTIMMAYLHGIDWEEIRNALLTVKAPINAKELRIEKKYIIKALTLIHKIRPERYTIVGNVGLSVKEAERLAKTTKVI